MRAAVRVTLPVMGALLVMATFAPTAYAQDVGYSFYDAQGRLQASVRAAGSGGAVTRYSLDGADNRTSRRTESVPVRALAYELQAGQFVVTSQAITSADGRFHLYVQTDGNVVLYGPSGAMWVAPGTHGRRSTTLTMQTDGNLVVSGPSGEPIWHSGTDGNPGARFVVQDDGNLVIYVGWTPIWASSTNHP